MTWVAASLGGGKCSYVSLSGKLGNGGGGPLTVLVLREGGNGAAAAAAAGDSGGMAGLWRGAWRRKGGEVCSFLRTWFFVGAAAKGGIG